MLVKELYLDCLLYEEATLAHYLYHLLKEKKLTLEDDSCNINLQLADHQKVREMITANVLGFHKVRIYSLKMSEKHFAFLFARSRGEAIQFFSTSFKKAPLNCHEYSLDFQLYRGKEVCSFRDMRKDFQAFPAIAGFFKREI
ncbi:hypothetical protein LS684_09530 [Cytobacillus spongiae]|jgi:hypothetical protein|uniref:hypothetical protein n=1 Tax=Cytobacillus spongiae TaxID=2901381 RepID=UPI001F1ABA58|nr:hypothetical protein [Cytobacillus spongiae]UII57637.1 hypothetical protein LS684_09530 [Cytobacillus spongiae]